MSSTQSRLDDNRRSSIVSTRPLSVLEITFRNKLRERNMQDYRDEVDDSGIEAVIQFENLPEIPGLKLSDISCERYREYDFVDRVYRINNPIALYFRPGGSTHRIVDVDGTSHCVAFPGKSTVLRWVNFDLSVPVNF